MKNLLTTLADNPVFQLSMSSKELFHSNFLYWLAICEDTKIVFQKLLSDCFGMMGMEYNPETMVVAREERHFDFSIRDKKEGYVLVLENKFKSIPDLEQLRRYEGKAGKKARFVLLSLVKDFRGCEDLERDGKWKVVPYDEYALCLQAAAETMPDGFNKHLIEKYSAYVLNFSKLMNESLERLKKSDCWKETKKDCFEPLRCNDLWQKIVLNDCISRLTTMFANDERFRHLRISYEPSKNWNNKEIHITLQYISHPSVEINCLLPSGVKLWAVLQWQGKICVGFVLPAGYPEEISKGEKVRDKERWKKAVKEKCEKLKLSNMMPLAEGEIYHSFLSKGKDGVFYVQVEPNTHSITGILGEMVELTAKAMFPSGER